MGVPEAKHVFPFRVSLFSRTLSHGMEYAAFFLSSFPDKNSTLCVFFQYPDRLAADRTHRSIPDSESLYAADVLK